jgi:uncharacterized membrane protein
MKRKTIMVVLAVIAAILTTIKTQFGLAINLAGLISFLTVAVAYIRGEAARDMAAIAQQSSKWTDPKFWTAMMAAVITALNGSLGLNLPIDIINVILLGVLAFLFKKKVATEPA